MVVPKKPPQLFRLITKMLLVMRLTVLFFVIGLVNIHAEGLSQKVSFSGTNVPLAKVFTAIEKQTGYTVFANKTLLRGVKPVTVSMKDMPLQTFLEAALRNQPIDFEINNRTIFIKEKIAVLPTGVLVTQTTVTNLFREITGLVTGTAGVPLEGATVSVKGTATVVTTDASGRYTINAEPDQTLVISYVGYQSTEELIKNRSTINVSLHEAAKEMDQVVVTALGIKKRTRELTYNVQEIGGKEVNTVKDPSFMNSLAGKVAGVTINGSASGMGSSVRVVMRGTKSLSGNNNALYVVDGIPLPALTTEQPGDVFSGAGQTGDGISNINPDDIESISVLSGPAAAALYGSQAANGVVMITTRKGVKEGFSVNLSNSTTFSSPFVMPKFQNTYGSETGSYSSWGEKLATPSDYNPRDFFQTGVNVMNAVSLSTGSEKNQTYLSLASTNANGIIHNNDFDRYNFSIRNTSKFLNDKMNLDLNASYIKVKEQNMLAQGQYFNPLIPVYLFPRGDDIRKYQAFERYNATRNFQTQFWPFGDMGFQMQNPYWITERDAFVNNKDRFLLSAGLKYDINNWMNIAGRVRMDRNTALLEKKYSASTSGLFAGEAGAYFRANQDTRQVYADLLLNINKTINDFAVTANLGISLQDNKDVISGIGGNLKSVPNLFSYLNMDQTQATLTQKDVHTQTQSVFGNVQIGYKNKVYLDVTARNDWASTLAGTSSYAFFYPSVGLSGILTDLLPIKSSTLSFLKARASYSGAGNSLPYGISALGAPMVNGSPQLNRVYVARDLKPENTKSYEAGLNFGFFRNKVKLDVTVYQSSTYNQLFNPIISQSSGNSSIYVNGGKVDNKGIEASLSVNQKLGKVVDWTSNVVFSLNRNKIVTLLRNYYSAETGSTVGVDTLNIGGTSDSYKIALTENNTMGDIYVNTLKTDEHGYIFVNSASQTVSANPNNYVKAGRSTPDFNLGFRNSFTYKAFDLSFLVAARVGGVGVSVTQAVMDAFGVSEASATARDAGGAVVNGYKLPAQAYYQTIGGGTSGIGSMYVYSATNVRLGEVSLAYEVPVTRYVKWVKGVSVSVIGRNLFMFYNKAPYDPELTSNTGTYFQGIDYFMQPSLRSIGFSVKCRF
jgi:TonB-linked SusC/RagA family outer membrane protein